MFKSVVLFFKGKGVAQLQHRPLHQPGVRRVGDPLPPIRNQRHTRSAARQRVHADAGGTNRRFSPQKKTVSAFNSFGFMAAG